jgi:hypothetical protein
VVHAAPLQLYAREGAPRTEGRVSARTGLNGYGEKKMSHPIDFKQRTGQPMAIRCAEYVILSPAFKRMHLHFSGESACRFIQKQYAHFMVYIGVTNVLVKAILVETFWSRGFHEVETPRFRDSRHVNVPLSF